MRFKVLLAGAVAWAGFVAANAYGVDPTYVIHISIDGGGSSYIQNQINLNNLPNFKKFQTEGAWTNNARTDYNWTITLPNHTSMLTSRPVNDQPGGILGHYYTSNVDPPSTRTLQNNPNNTAGIYIASIMDVVHDNGLSTAMYTTKTKFSLYDVTYNGTNGALDVTGANNGRDKIDTYFENDDTNVMMNAFLSAMPTQKYNFSFLHFADTDEAGHDGSAGGGWGNAKYNTALQYLDGKLGQIFTLVTTDPTFIGKTTIVLTADHGGTGTGHSDETLAIDYTIPFYVWGAGVTPGTDLYALNLSSRLDPATGRPNYNALGQPIRNGDSANLELDLLGLGPVPGSTINFNQNLAVAVPEPASLGVLALGAAALIVRRKKRA